MKKIWYENKTVIVTGASSGFGKLLCQRLVNDFSCQVFGVARREDRLAALKKELGNNFSYRAFDVGVKSEWVLFAEELKNSNASLDVLINNAGMLPPFSRFDNLPDGLPEKVMQTNFFASVYSIGALLPLIKRSDSPAIINISSSAALATVAGTSLYSASKAALKSFTDSLILEYPKIYISAVCPGFANTDVFKNQKTAGEKESRLIKRVCGKPEYTVNRILNGMKKKKKLMVIGADAKCMDFFGRLMPIATDKLMSAVVKKFAPEMFAEVFQSD